MVLFLAFSSLASSILPGMFLEKAATAKKWQAR